MSGMVARQTVGQSEYPERILLVGNPNVGKSVLFNLLTGSYATVSNYPGTTVEVSRGRLRGLGRRPEVIDTPGINTLTPLSVDEIVTRDILLDEQNYIVVQVIDARNLPRGLRITAELGELGVPLVIALNMMDEAIRDGLHIAVEKLADLLGVEVIPTVAVERRGIGELFQALRKARRPRFHVHYAEAIEGALNQMVQLLPDTHVNKRAIAAMFLAGDESIEKRLGESLSAEVLEQLRQIRSQVQQLYSEPLDYVLAQHRWQAAEAMAEAVTARRPVTVSRAREIASRATMHPVWGPIILIAVLYAMYVIVGKIGAGSVADFFSTCIMGSPRKLVMGLGDEKVPAHVQVAGRARLKQSDSTIRIELIGPLRPIEMVISPPPVFARFLREGTQYVVEGHVICRADVLPEAAVELEYPDHKRERMAVAVAKEGPGQYSLRGSFEPGRDGAQYKILLKVSGTSTVTLRGLALYREAEGYVIPWLHSLVQRYVPGRFIRYLLVGEYGVITMGLALAIGIVLPIVAFFFLFFALLEDSGYLARLTVLANKVFTVMGLNGRAVVPMVLGLGCDTMATLAARVLDSAKARTTVIFLLALGVPCSAQLGVVMSMAGAIGPLALVLVFGVVVAELFAAGYVASKVIPGPRSDFVVEIPLLRMPLLSNVLRKTWQRTEWFLREALPYFILGTAALAVMAWFGILDLLENLLRPIIAGLLSLPPDATYAFLVGFLRRDYGAAGLFDLRYEGRLDNLQTVVALITMTLFVPCIANFLVMIKEQGIKRAAVMVVIIITLALLTGGAVNFLLRLAGVNL